MNYIDAVVYGIIQGLSEFIPVSSSGHLAVLPLVLQIKDPGIIFDLMMHVGTALAIIVYFHGKVFKLLQEYLLLLKNPLSFKKVDPFAKNFFYSTICSVIFILILYYPARAFGRSAELIAWNLIIFGVVMYLADRTRYSNDKNPLNVENNKFSIIVGLAQALAIFPGVSRSGITLTAGRFLGQSRIAVGEYSFLMSLPIIFAGATQKALSLFTQSEALHFDFFSLLIGMLVSFIVGLGTIHFFLKVLKRFGLIYFSVYRIVIGVLILTLL